MKLWLLRPNYDNEDKGALKPWRPWYDRCFGFVVRASTEVEARQLASEDASDEGEKAWLSDFNSTCEELLSDGQSEIVLQNMAKV